MVVVMHIFIVIDIQLFKIKLRNISLIILTKQGNGEVLSQIMTFIKPHRHKSHHRRNIIAYSVVIFYVQFKQQTCQGRKIRES